MGWIESFRGWLYNVEEPVDVKPDVTLQRVAEDADGTYGVLIYGKTPLCVTLENNWYDNKRNLSCIPEGVYKCSPHNGAKYKDVWILKDVPDRSAILIHAGNVEADTRGCILVGSEFGNLRGKKAVLGSVKALKMLRGVLPDNFTLEIKRG